MQVYFLLALMLLTIAVDVYFYYSMRMVVKGRERKRLVPKWMRLVYWGFSLFSALFFCLAMYYYVAQIPPPKFARIYITGFIFIVLISKLIGAIFFLIHDIQSVLIFIKNKLFPPKQALYPNSKKIGRSTFIKQSGLIASAVPFVSMMYGVVKSAFDYNVIRIKIKSPNLPAAFNGFKILQISDIHTGSFISDGPLRDAVKIINEQYPDVVFFTGDLVNEVAEEALPFKDVLKQISAPFGVFSILGNHDYGDYFYPKGDERGRAHNYSLMKDIHHEMNWDILLNDHRIIEKNGEKIGILGVENWGDAGRFQKYGDLSLAKKDMAETPFNILLSHDPSHWNSIVSKENNKIDLTLSGHTHGFQMGIEIPGFVKWSPSQYIYEQWAGLYAKGGQKIYVNRGLGFLGYPGRLGILPEITVIELERSESQV